MGSAAQSCAMCTSSMLDATNCLHFVRQLLAVLGKADDLCPAQAGTCQASNAFPARASAAAGGKMLWMRICVLQAAALCINFIPQEGVCNTGLQGLESKRLLLFPFCFFLSMSDD